MVKFDKKTTIILSVGVAILGAVIGGALMRTTKPKAEENKPPLSLTPVLHSQVKPVLVRYVPLSEADVSMQERERLQHQIHNLYATGSTSGGELTQEFKQTTHAKMTYRFGHRQDLSFKAVKRQVIQYHLPQGFVWTGRQYEGEKGEQGFNGIYRLFENPSSKARFEISESKLSKDKPLILIQELFNEELEGVPLRFETLQDKKGVIYHHAEFVAGEQYIIINSKNINTDDVKNVIKVIISELSEAHLDKPQTKSTKED